MYTSGTIDRLLLSDSCGSCNLVTFVESQECNHLGHFCQKCLPVRPGSLHFVPHPGDQMEVAV